MVLINYSLLVDPDHIGPWASNNLGYASLQVINDVPQLAPKVAGKKILISEATIRADLLFDDENGVDCILLSYCVSALAAEEELSTSQHSRAASSCKVAQGTPNQSAAQSHRTASVTRYWIVLTRYCLPSQGCSHTKGLLTSQGKLGDSTEATLYQAKQYSRSKQSSRSCPIRSSVVKHHALWVRIKNLTKQKRDEGKKELRRKVSSVKLGRIRMKELCTEEQILDLETTQDARTRDLITPRTLNFEDEAGPSSPLRQFSYGSEEQHNVLNKQDMVEELKRKKIDSSNNQSLETTMMRRLLENSREWDAEDERKSFLKGQGYKNLQKLKYPQMKELYDKVQASIKESSKTLCSKWIQRRKEMLKRRDALRLSRKRKATITEEQPSKKPKLRSETTDELRNYLRVVDFEKNAQDKESLEGISMITELQVIDSPDGESAKLVIEDGTSCFTCLADEKISSIRSMMIRMLDNGMEVKKRLRQT
ncbi:hypothetical protein Tco_0951813 [Tanacetum coccineum]|uniref:Uncharacterized protein n=1 Tax=Tanacetum coccineum TaxID=301880 RepID=A0ABQ5DX16_9ASTR